MKTVARLLTALLLISFPALGENLLTNPGFTSDLNGWAPSNEFLTPTWNGIDANGSTTSGSANLRSTSSIAFGGTALAQCVPVTAGARYDLGAKIHIPGNQTNSGDAWPALIFYGSTNCSTNFIANVSTPSTSVPNGRFVAGGGSSITAPVGARSASVALLIVKKEAGGSFQGNVDDVFFGPTGGCLPTQTVLCLANGRFHVQSAWEEPGGTSGFGQAIQLTPDSGYFWFFNAENIEMIVKVLNGCTINSNYWVFSGGLTNVTVYLTFTDTTTHESSTFTNPQGVAFQPIQVTQSFPTCP